MDKGAPVIRDHDLATTWARPVLKGEDGMVQIMHKSAARIVKTINRVRFLEGEIKRERERSWERVMSVPGCVRAWQSVQQASGEDHAVGELVAVMHE
eukprot:6440725-Alexandrium_andersonii.AAC.1